MLYRTNTCLQQTNLVVIFTVYTHILTYLFHTKTWSCGSDQVCTLTGILDDSYALSMARQLSFASLLTLLAAYKEELDYTVLSNLISVRITSLLCLFLLYYDLSVILALTFHRLVVSLQELQLMQYPSYLISSISSLLAFFSTLQSKFFFDH